MRTLILIAVAFISLQAVAQERRKGHPKEGNKERMEMLKDATPDEIATLKSKQLTLALDLTDKQQSQVKEILLKEATAMKEKMKEREKMKEQDDAKKPSKEEHLQMRNERLDAQIAMKKQMKSILNEDQYKRWEKIQGRRMKEGRGDKKMRLRKQH